MGRDWAVEVPAFQRTGHGSGELGTRPQRDTRPRLVPYLMETLSRGLQKGGDGLPSDVGPPQMGRRARVSSGGIQSAHVVLVEQSLGILREGHQRGHFREKKIGLTLWAPEEQGWFPLKLRGAAQHEEPRG